MQIRINTLFLSLFLFRNLGFKANCHFTPVCGCILGVYVLGAYVTVYLGTDFLIHILDKIRICTKKIHFFTEPDFFKYQLLFFLEL
jgi:hypothetical protein